eukprot:TRINITY_DN1478_c0_g1_i1.p1 TRINITY_DN1478_c0_g1~~TRINITY_DN1478_c0_g1_i1.p1  ORF type:complete len:687 (+),score=225.41 TRINITY_DN1478_c0_g1_i1:183-2243(+)
MVKGKARGKFHHNKKKSRKERLVSTKTTGYMTRSQVTRKLQVNIQEFRRLCILKGIHPVEPLNSRIRKMRDKTWYYAKDITFLKHDPAVDYFTDKRRNLKKIRAATHANEPYKQKMLRKQTPHLHVDHMVKERYPTLQDAMNDMDDALSIIFLFNEAQHGFINKTVYSKYLDDCSRLSREWMCYVSSTHSLRKIFLSIKGVYYQAEVKGATITWLAPHTAKIKTPSGIDIQTMSYFLEFYISMLSFVFYRLFIDAGFHYPPSVDKNQYENTFGLKAVRLVKKSDLLQKKDKVTIKPTDVATLSAEMQARLKEVQKQIQTIAKQEPTKSDKAEAIAVAQSDHMVLDDDDDIVIDDEFKTESDQKTQTSTTDGNTNDTPMHKRGLLFSGFKFFINREVPKEHIQFVIKAFGGDDVWDGVIDEDHPSITHFIVDRDWPKDKIKQGREYIQPQWVFDSCNAGFLLPYHEYAPDAKLPPHLSPFVNDVEAGYVPKQREHIEQLMKEAERTGQKWDEKDEEEEDGDADVKSDDEDDDEGESLEAQYQNELKAESENRSYSAAYVQDQMGDDEAASFKNIQDSDDEEVIPKKSKKQLKKEKEKAEEDKRVEMTEDLLSFKKRRIMRAIKRRVNVKDEGIRKLEEKRAKIEKEERMADKAMKAQQLQLGGGKKRQASSDIAPQQQPKHKKKSKL